MPPERAGKKVAQIDWVGGAAANINGPIVDFTNFFSNRGVLVGAADPVEQPARRSSASTTRMRTALVPTPSTWSNVPTGDPAAPPKEATWAIPTTFAAQNPNRTYNVYIYDSVVGGGVAYDHVIVSPVGKTGAAQSVDLAVGDFMDIKLIGANGLIGPRAGQTVGHYVKLISIAPDASQFKLYDTSLTRAIARCGAVCNGLPAGGAGEDRLEKYIADNLLPVGRRRLRAAGGGGDRRGHLRRAGPRPRAGLQPPGHRTTSSRPCSPTPTWRWSATRSRTRSSISSSALVSPTDADGDPNPCYDVNPKFDDVQCTGTRHRRTRRRSARSTSGAPTPTPTRSSASPAR